MIEKTKAVVLRVAPVMETSRVVNWMTEDFGRLATLIKGSQRPKSLFLGQYDLFYTCELLFYTGRSSDLHIARECSPLKTRDRFRSDWKAAAAAAYLADLVAQSTLPDAPAGSLFQLLETGLDFVADRGARSNLVFWFELELLGRMGLAPLLSKCMNCGARLDASSASRQFSYAHGGLHCGACGDASRRESSPLAPDILAILTAWQRSAGPQAAWMTRCTGLQLDQIERLLGLFLRYHLDTRLPSRDIALDLLKN